MMLPDEAIKKIVSGQGLAGNERGISKNLLRWPGGLIPYEIDSSICE